MKKLSSLILALVALTVVNAQSFMPQHLGPATHSKGTHQGVIPSSSSNLRAIGCDTLNNLGAADTLLYYYPMDTAAAAIAQGAIPGLGYFDGNGAIANGPTLFTMGSIAEKFETPAGLTGQYVTSAIVYFSYVNIKPTTADSNILVTAYVYDTTGVGLGGYGPGAAVDSATATLGSIATYYGAEFVFTHQGALATKGFFISVKLPQTVGDTIAVAFNDGSSGKGHAFIEPVLGSTGQWIPVDSIVGVEVGGFIFPVVCGSTSSCPTITVSATQSGSTGTASATGGAGTYTYAWSNNATGATATGLVNGTTYHVTATDMNGCTGVGMLTIAGITAIEAGVTNFSVFPNPSNGVFTASITLETASDVTISIVDMTGSKIYESTDKSVKDLNKSINLSTAATGVYFVSVKTDKGTANQRIVIK